MKNSLCWLLPVVLLVALFGSSSHAAEAVPGDACATAEHIRSVGGPETSGAMHIMVCQGGTWKAILSSNASGHVTKVGDQTCAASDFLKFDGTKIICTTGTCGDTTPNAFSYTDLTAQTVSTLVTSNIVQVSGFGCAVSVVITGTAGSPQFRTCSDSGCSTVVQDWTSSSSSMASGEYLQLRITTSGTGGDVRRATVVVGNTASVWSVTTDGDCATTPAVGTVCADGTVYAGLTPDGNVPMYVTRCDAGQTWDGSACTGARLQTSWNNGTTNWTWTGATNTITGEANTNTLVATADAGSDYAAAEYCYALDDGNGNSDWYLPAKQELSVIQAGRTAIGNFSTGWDSDVYYSSTESTDLYCFWNRFDTGTDTAFWKSSSTIAKIRCARK